MAMAALRARAAAAFVILLALVVGALAQTIEPLTIVTRTGRHPFLIEVARNDADRAQGLMFRRSLAPDRGMLFDFGRQTQPTVMWMKNTYIRST